MRIDTFDQGIVLKITKIFLVLVAKVFLVLVELKIFIKVLESKQ